MKKRKGNLVEQSLAGQFAAVKLDKANRVVHDVAVLHETSVNCSFEGAKGRRFSEKAMQDAARLVEGVKCYFDHDTANPFAGKSVREIAGFFENGRLDPDKIVRADLHYRSVAAPEVESLVEDVADKIGLSIYAKGTSHLDEQSNTENVDELVAMRSVDLVTDPGSTKSLFESRAAGAEDEGEEDMEIDFGKLTLNDLLAQRPDIAEQLAERVKQGIEATGVTKRLEEQLATQATELKTLRERNEALVAAEAQRARIDKVNALLLEAKLPENQVTDTFRKVLVEAKDEAAVKALIADRKAVVEQAAAGVHGMGGERTPGGTPVVEGTAPTDDAIVAAFKG
jgi:hypothetical protein